MAIKSNIIVHTCWYITLFSRYQGHFSLGFPATVHPYQGKKVHLTSTRPIWPLPGSPYPVSTPCSRPLLGSHYPVLTPCSLLGSHPYSLTRVTLPTTKVPLLASLYQGWGSPYLYQLPLYQGQVSTYQQGRPINVTLSGQGPPTRVTLPG